MSPTMKFMVGDYSIYSKYIMLCETYLNHATCKGDANN